MVFVSGGNLYYNRLAMVRLYEGYAVIHIETRRTLNNNFTFYCEKNSVNELIRILEDKKVKIIKEENR